jgi:hypothetical protein
MVTRYQMGNQKLYLEGQRTQWPQDTRWVIRSRIIVFSVLQDTASDYLFAILWPLCSLFFKIRLLITHLVSCDHCVLCPSRYGFWIPIWYHVTIVFSVLQDTTSDYPFGIMWPLCSLSFKIRLLITHLVSCDHCVLSRNSKDREHNGHMIANG